MSRLVASQRAWLAPAWVRENLSRKAQALPSLDLRFADTKSLADAVTGQSLVTFTRASSATYVGSDGLIKTATTNLLLRSEDFSIGVVWPLSGSTLPTITANAGISPDGNVTADLWTRTITSSSFISQAIAKAATTIQYTFSIFVKQSVGNFCALRVQGTYPARADVVFNIATGAISNAAAAFGGFTAASASIIPYPNNWYRLTFTATSDTATSYQCIASFNSNNAVIDGIDSASNSAGFLWGAQLEQSSTVGEYIPTTSTINSAPRFNHNPTTGESLGLLVEEQRANLVTNSATFQPSSGGSPASYTVDQVAPDGTTTASRQTAANPRTFVDYTGIANAQYTFSVYAKATSGTITISLQLKNAATDTVITAGSNVTLTTAWQRLTVTGTTNGAITGTRIEVFGAPAGTVFWGAQLEAGAFASSYIPTTTAAATRSADVASITGTAFSSWYRQDEGTVFAESRVQEFTVTNFSRIASLDRGDATTNFAAIVRSSALNRVEYSVFVGTGQAVGLQPAITFAAGSTLRSAFVYKTDDFIAAANGTLSPADTLGTVTTAVTTLGVGMQGNGGLPYNGTIRRLTYWPQRLANSTLQAITQ